MNNMVPNTSPIIPFKEVLGRNEMCRLWLEEQGKER